MSAARSDLREAVVADDQPDTVLGQPFLGVGGRADGDDLLVAEPQLLDRAEPQVVDAADDRVAVGWLRRRSSTWRTVYAGGEAAGWRDARPPGTCPSSAVTGSDGGRHETPRRRAWDTVHDIPILLAIAKVIREASPRGRPRVRTIDRLQARACELAFGRFGRERIWARVRQQQLVMLGSWISQAASPRARRLRDTIAPATNERHQA